MVGASFVFKRPWAFSRDAGAVSCPICAPRDWAARTPEKGFLGDRRPAASNSAISLVQGPANAFVAAGGSTAERRAALMLGLDIPGTPLFAADYSFKSASPRGRILGENLGAPEICPIP